MCIKCLQVAEECVCASSGRIPQIVDQLGPEMVPDPYFEDRRNWTRTHPNNTAAEERAAIVDWLRDRERQLRDRGELSLAVGVGGAALCIERGEHITGERK